jgi:CHAD domain-containing protein
MNLQTSYDSLWRKRLDALNAVWPEFLAGHAEALHKARVASRRIREALPVVAAGAPPERVKKLRRKMRDLTRYLGPIRELDVELDMLDKKTARDGGSPPALTVMRGEVASRRHALRDRLEDDQPVADVKKLIKKLERVAEEGGQGTKKRAKQAKSDHEHAWRGVLAATLLRRAKRLKAALEEVGPLYAPERLHDVRIATKKLRYALEIVQDAGNADAKALVKTLRREQERLGHLHDLQALLRHVREAEMSPHAGSRLADLTAYTDSLERECRQLHAQFVEHRDNLFECVTQVRHQLIPALTTTTRQQARVASSGRLRLRAAKKA